jgi:hypothetical protein
VTDEPIEEQEENEEQEEDQDQEMEEQKDQGWEEGEEEGEEEDEGSGEFDELSKMHVPQNMKHFVKFDSQRPSDQQGESEDKSQKSTSKLSKKPISIKTLRVLQKPQEEPADRNKLKRKTFSKQHLEETPSITKSELKRVKIRPFPKNKVVADDPNKQPKDLPTIKEEEVKPPKEDSFFKNFDASRLDFSKYRESGQSFNKKDGVKEKKDAKVVVPDLGNTFLEEEVSNRANFRIKKARW